jgi:hypothetical protein
MKVTKTGTGTSPAAAPDAEAAAMFTPEAAALITERLGLNAEQFARFALGVEAVFRAMMAAEAECGARLAGRRGHLRLVGEGRPS